MTKEDKSLDNSKRDEMKEIMDMLRDFQLKSFEQSSKLFEPLGTSKSKKWYKFW